MRSGWSDEGLLLLGSFHDSLIARSLSRGVAREGWVCQRSQVVSGQSLESVTWHWHQAPTWHGAHSHWESGDCRGWEPLDHGYIEDRTSQHIVDNLQRSDLIWGKTHPYWYISFVCFYPRNSSSGASGQPLASLFPRVEAAEWTVASDSLAQPTPPQPDTDLQLEQIKNFSSK